MLQHQVEARVENDGLRIDEDQPGDDNEDDAGIALLHTE